MVTRFGGIWLALLEVVEYLCEWAVALGGFGSEVSKVLALEKEIHGWRGGHRVDGVAEGHGVVWGSSGELWMGVCVV